MASVAPSIEVVVLEKRELATNIVEFLLARADGTALPVFEAGAHIDLELGAGLVRSYSLCSAPGETGYYAIAVQREPAGRGGSTRVHQIQTGAQLLINPPANDFALDETSNADPHFIAGGIGITPIISMIRRMEAVGRGYSLIYLTHSPERTAFANFLKSPDRLGDIRIHHDHGMPERMLGIDAILGRRAADAHIYCCGPEGLMKAVRDAADDHAKGRVHFESFVSATVQEDACEFTVVIASTGQTVGVSADKSILDALREAGLELDSSCEAGTCGTCQTGYLEGEVAHEDYVLLDDDRETQMMICVSRATSKRLTLDL